MGDEVQRGAGQRAPSGARGLAAPLLATKHRIPPLRPALVDRPRLIERLEAGRHRRLTLVAAPAGFGKTTLVLDWLHAAAARVAWLSLDSADSDPARFLAYLVAALGEVEPRAGRAAGQLLGLPQPPPPQLLVTMLINELAAAESGLVLVLDDYHALSGMPVHEAVQLWVENAPPTVHTVIITREDPPLPLPKLRVRGQLTEIRERDLRFTQQETDAFLAQTMGLHLAAEVTAALVERTEGWIAGLQLAALALQEREGQAAGETFIRSFTGDDRYVIDYLMSEVLERQTPELRDFLCRTAILDRLCAGLCDALVPSGGSQAILEDLERANLFLVPLDHRREWYRYHRLFAEFLRSRLAPPLAVQLHRRAAAWFEAHAAPAEGVGHALAFGTATGQWEDAVRLIRSLGEAQLLSGSVHTLSGWLAGLSPDCVASDPELLAYRAWAATLSGDLGEGERCVGIAESALAAAPQPDAFASVPGKLALLRGLLAMSRQDHPATAEQAGRALQLLDPGALRWRIIALWILAEAQERTRPIREAIASLTEVQAAARTSDNPVFAATVDAQLAAALDNHGCRRQALEVCREALRRHAGEAGARPPVAGLLLSRLALLHYAADELAEARAAAEEGSALADRFGLPDLVSFAHGVLAMVRHAQGAWGAGRESLRLAERTGPQGLGETSWLAAWAASAALRDGDLAAAQAWAAAEGPAATGEPDYLHFDAQLTYARLLLAEGRAAEARGRLARLEQFATERGLNRWLISVHVLSALAAAGSRGAGEPPVGEPPVAATGSAREQMARAVALAAGEGYLRPFLDEGPDVPALVASVRYAAPAFVDALLAASGPGEPAREEDSRNRTPQPGPAGRSVPGLVEPLSDRELEVLQLIAAGLSNAEIAARLIIALGTVKRHINNIYGKLGVASRTQALARARDLGLL